MMHDLFRQPLTIICYWFFFSNILCPVELSAKSILQADLGPMFIESGDDRLQGGWVAHGYFKDYVMTLGGYQRHFQIVDEMTWMLNITKTFKGFKGNFRSEVGAALLAETTSVSDSGFSQSETRWNLGGVFALRWRFVESKSFYMTLNWESAIFPAGLQGLLLLSTGRKQMISAVMGMEL
ncbi:MAG: hypothetical protein AB8C84_03470 [Oligoflexales bacterium]